MWKIGYWLGPYQTQPPVSQKKKEKNKTKKKRQNFECAETEKDCIDPSSMEFKPLHT